MTHVVIDGELLCHPGGAGRGLGRYVDALVTSLPDVPGLEVSAVMPGPFELRPEVHRVDAARSGRTDRWGWLEQLARSGVDARRANADLFHSPGMEPPLWYGGPKVQTLHDVIPLVYPSESWGSEPRRWRIRGRLMRRADAVISISKHTADLAIRHLGIQASRLHVIYHGVTPIFRDVVGPRPEVERPYLLYVGGWGPHKGFKEAFEVIGRVAEAGLPHELRLVGGFDEWAAPRLDALVRGAPRPDLIQRLGQTSDEELVRLYRGASALIVTSRYEGFGRPTIEALAIGCPVVSFDNSSLGEVLGEGGILVPDGNVGAFSRAIIDLLRDDQAQLDLRTRALDRARLFDWGRCAEEHASVYDEVVR